jgi:hypothetical protein
MEGHEWWGEKTKESKGRGKKKNVEKKPWGIPWLAGRLLTSQEDLCSLEGASFS